MAPKPKTNLYELFAEDADLFGGLVRVVPAPVVPTLVDNRVLPWKEHKILTARNMLEAELRRAVHVRIYELAIDLDLDSTTVRKLWMEA